MVVFLSFIITIIILKLIIQFFHFIPLSDKKTHKLHTENTPHLGGVAIFVGFIIAQLYCIDSTFISIQMQSYYILISSTILLFILGFVDDIIHISANHKFIFQQCIACFLIWNTDIRIESFHGLFGIFELPQWMSYMFSVLVLLFFINAYNLIDGIDSLSATTGIYIFIIFLGIFIINNMYVESMISLSLIGTLFAFLIFNKPPAKIFMGDSGSLSIGLIVAFFTIRVANLPLDSIGTINPVFPMIVLAYPAIDTLRVFFIRLSKGVSPFGADKNHIHHVLINLGFGHGKATIIIISISCILTYIAYKLRFSPNFSFFILVPVVIILANVPNIILSKK